MSQDDIDQVVQYYGLDDPFPTEWKDTNVDLDAFIFVLGNGESFEMEDVDKEADPSRSLEHNFEAFVKVRSTMDAVYNEMKNDFLQEQKNWGVASIERYIDEANDKAALIIQPIMDNRAQADRLKATLALIEKHRYLFDLPSKLAEDIKSGLHDSVIRDYKRGLSQTEESRTLPHSPELALNLIEQRRVIERIWSEVEVVVEDYRDQLWKDLSETRPNENFLSIIKILLELGVEDNPIWVWLESQVDHIKTSMENGFEQLNDDLQIIRNELSDSSQPTPANTSMYFLNAIKFSTTDKDVLRDTPEIIKMWMVLKELVENLALTFGKQITSFWDAASRFLDGTYQKTLPTGLDGQSKIHLTFSDMEQSKVRSDARELVDILANRMADFFVDTIETSKIKAQQRKENEDMNESDIEHDEPDYSNHKPTKLTSQPNNSVTSLSARSILANSLKKDRNKAENTRQEEKVQTDVQNINSSVAADTADTANNADKSYDLYAFLPPNANAIGTSHFLSQILGILGSVASELAGLSISSKHIDVLRNMMGTIRERCIGATCLAWQQDAKNFRVLEDWAPISSRTGTRIPKFFLQYQSIILSGIQELIFVTAAEQKSTVLVILPPSSRVVSNIKTQFVNSIFLALDGLVKDAVATESRSLKEADGYSEKHVYTIPMDHRLLLMISNLDELKNNIVTALFERFSTAFSIQLTDNSNIIGDAMSQLDEQLFTAYTKKKRSNNSNMVRIGILKSGIQWPNLPNPTDVSPYVYKVLLQLVLIHSQVTSVTPLLLKRIISDLLHHFASTILESFRQIDNFSVGGMLQATIDVEFCNQKMTAYVTPEIEELFQTTYATVQDATNKSNVDVSAMTNQLEGMKKLLYKCHKYSKLEFSCFKDGKPAMAGTLNENGSLGRVGKRILASS
ncbi:exocyst complex component Sec5-domain-containing protein [Lipomyces japonicus]|uniref:exocyst complex component Sec5-domain-containing protein n=1 Tax=Lipomyces japonicus TaxID=56871 RepID=UPI0034CD15C5